MRDNKTHLSFAFAAVISSIETLNQFYHREKKINRCDKCNLEIYSVRRKFRDFFKFYVSDEKKLDSHVDDLYNIRSKILHRGELLLSDIERFNIDDAVRLEYLIRLIRISIINWLSKSHTRKIM